MKRLFVIAVLTVSAGCENFAQVAESLRDGGSTGGGGATGGGGGVTGGGGGTTGGGGGTTGGGGGTTGGGGGGTGGGGVPAGYPKTGDPCSSSGQCDPGGSCFMTEFGGTWTGGYCSKLNCVSSTECSTDGGAVCVIVQPSDVFCARHCQTAGAQSDCRAGYVCTAIEYSDGGMSLDGFCFLSA